MNKYGIYQRVNGGEWKEWAVSSNKERFERLCMEAGGPLERMFIAYEINFMSMDCKDRKIDYKLNIPEEG